MASPGEAFCRQCGRALQAPAPTVVSPQPPPQPINPQPASQPGSQPGSQRRVAPPSTITAVSPQMGQMPSAQPGVGGQQFQPSPPINVGKKRRSPILLGCLVFLGLIVVVAGIGGIYVWRRSVYSPPDRQTPAIPERAQGTMTEFPVDNDPNDPSRPTSVQTEILGGTLAQNSTSTPATKLPPGVDRSGLAKGATSMTSSTYKPKKNIPSSGGTASNQGDVYINVVTTMPNQQNFGNGLANSIVKATGGTQTGVRVTSPSGGIYVGSKIRSNDAYVYVLTKQNSDIVIIIYSDDTSNQAMVDRLAQSVGNGQGLLDYPEVKDSLWTLPASVPSGLTLVEINTMSGAQIEAQISRSAGGNADMGEFISQMRSFIPDRLTGARYVDSNRQEWATVSFEYGSSFAAWRTWLLARGALGLGGAESVTVRDVNGVYLNQDGSRILVFQKGPYLIFLSGPGSASTDRLVALGNTIQV
jgi:hypothetical protein